VTSTSLQHCGPLHQWFSEAVTDSFAAYNATVTHRAFQSARQHLPVEDLDLHLIHGTLDPPKSTLQSVTQSVQLVLHELDS